MKLPIYLDYAATTPVDPRVAESQDYAESMQPIIGKLYRNRGIEIAVYGRPLVKRRMRMKMVATVLLTRSQTVKAAFLLRPRSTSISVPSMTHQWRRQTVLPLMKMSYRHSMF